MSRNPKIYDSMAAAASGLEISLELVRRAKKKGCTAFKGSRVDGAVLKKFIAEREAELKSMGDEISLKEKKLNEEIRRLKLNNDKAESKLILKTDVAAALRRILGPVSQILESKIVQEWPDRVAGIAPEAARAYGRILSDDILAKFQELGKEFPA